MVDVTTFTIVVWAGSTSTAGCVMGMLGKVVAISGGVFAGGGLGFYLKETYYLRLKREERSRLEEEWMELVRARKDKEQLLRTMK